MRDVLECNKITLILKTHLFHYSWWFLLNEAHEAKPIWFFFKLNRENKFLGIFPSIRFTDKSTYTESQTKKYDLVSIEARRFHCQMAADVTLLLQGFNILATQCTFAIIVIILYSLILLNPLARIQVSVVVVVPSPVMLCCLLHHLPGAQGMVLLGPQHALWIPPNIW